jgi:hypothetical protein
MKADAARKNSFREAGGREGEKERQGRDERGGVR